MTSDCWHIHVCLWSFLQRRVSYVNNDISWPSSILSMLKSCSLIWYCMYGIGNIIIYCMMNVLFVSELRVGKIVNIQFQSKFCFITCLVMVNDVNHISCRCNMISQNLIKASRRSTKVRWRQDEHINFVSACDYTFKICISQRTHVNYSIFSSNYVIHTRWT